MAGITQYFKEKSKNVKIFLADPPGSVLYSLKKKGVLERTGDGSITEGIGQGRLTDNLAEIFPLIDDAVHVVDADTIRMVYSLLDTEGLFIGASSALNVAAAYQVAQKLGPGHNGIMLLII